MVTRLSLLCLTLMFAVLGILASIRRVSPTGTRPITWIAHAMGGIDGVDYTNSLEAFKWNYKLGYRIFEVDLLLTKDGGICAFHSLDSMEREFGLALRVIEIATRQFLQQRYYGRYTPLCLEQIEALLDKYPDWQIVIDIKESRNKHQEQDLTSYKESFDRIYAQLIRRWKKKHPERLHRMLPQIYSESDYNYLMSLHPFPRILYTLYRTQASDSKVVDFVARHPSLQIVAADRRRFSRELAHSLRAAGRDIFVYTVNAAAEVSNYLHLGATGFYSDFHPPRQILRTEAVVPTL